MHARLDHLVNYSSQLIFVGGDSLAQHNEFVTEFLARKSEQANVAYLIGKENLSLSQARQRIVEQLVGKLRLDYARPLAEILPHALGNSPQFILIAIVHADKLHSDILSELWDIIRHSRSERLRHHMNVLLFGPADWAAESKACLPAHRDEQPVLLAQERINLSDKDASSVNQDQTDDGFIYEHRNTRSFKDAWWWRAMMMVLVMSAALLALHRFYPDGVSMVWQDVQELTTPDIANQLPEPAALKIPANQLPVTHWAAPASEDMADKNNLPQAAESAVESEQNTNPSDEYVEVPHDLQSPEHQDMALIDTDNTLQTEQTEQTEQTDPLLSVPKQDAVTVEPEIDSRRYYLQIVGMENIDLLNEFVLRNKLSGELLQYATRRDDHGWHVVVWRHSFDSLEAARAGIAEFRKQWPDLQPFVKSGRQISREQARASSPFE
ncbi:SPOR domain-containing protein [Pseudobowmanella zhangzhouensis]|uniref:SPOR domain-containing protein n=1 Tax=Pseudobowmanella zhangzhouensis TaxID=1537679 RepID=UPI0010DE57C2|nr:hypothetical protein TK45_13370 [Bowmanella sp. JS7-9]